MILTPLEIVKKTSLSKDYPAGDLCPLIEIEEHIWFESCALGLDFYDALRADLTEVPANIKEFSRAVTYSNEDMVTFYGSVLQSTVDNNKTYPTEDTLGHWIEIPKFKTACVDKLWCTYIAPALSYFIVSTHLTSITYKISAKGATKYSDDFRQNTTGLVTIERGERHDLQKSYQMNADRFYDAMIAHMSKSNCPILIHANLPSECTPCAPKNSNRRIAFRR